MSVTGLAFETEQTTCAQTRQRFPWPEFLILVAWISACWSPLLLRHLNQMLAKPHYQFILAIPVLAFLLARKSIQSGAVNPVSPGSTPVSMFLIMVSMAIVGVASWLSSTWIGVLGYLLCLLIMAYVIGGRGLVKTLLPAWVVVCCILPLPFGLDLALIQELREVVTTWSSVLLNYIGVLHLVDGNSMEIPGHAFFIADACTGIHSLFVLAASAVFWGCWCNRSILHILCLAGCSVGLAVLENVARVTGVIVAYEKGFDFSEGWKHDLLGLVLFTATCLLLLSADQFLAFLLPTRAFLGRMLGWKRASTESIEPSQNPSKSPSRFVMVTVGVFAAMIGVFQIRQFPATFGGDSNVSPGGAFNISELGENALPQDIEGFRRAKYEAVTRSSNFGMLSSNSQIWSYVGDEFQLQISLDYPYEFIHPLSLCYELNGWTTIRNELIEPRPDFLAPEVPVSPFAYTVLHKSIDGAGHLFYSYINFAGEEGVRLYPVKRELTAKELVSARIKSLIGQSESDNRQVENDLKTNAGLRGPMCQVQLLVQLPDKLTDEQRERVQRFFVTARRELKARLLNPVSASVDN